MLFESIQLIWRRRALCSSSDGRYSPGYWSNIDNQRLFFQKLESQLGIKSPEDWYGVTTRQMVQEGGSSLLGNYYNWSLINALKTIYPQHKWATDAPDAHKAPKFWQNPDNLRALFDSIAKQLEIESIEDWYTITRAKIVQTRSDAKSALRYFSGSVSDALQSAYPDHNWLPWKFSKTKAGLWDDKEFQKRFFDWAAAQLGVATLDDWYNISGVQVDNIGGKYVVEHYYNHSLPKALAALYPEHKWDPSKFLFRPKEFWKSSKHQISASSSSGDQATSDGMTHLRDLVNRVCHSKGIDPSLLPSDHLYDFSSADLIAAGGASPLRKHFNSSPAQLLKAVFPNHEWLEWKFSTLSRGWWADMSNQRTFMDWIARNVFKFDPDVSWTSWYDISARQISSAGGSRLVSIYGGSPIQILRVVYPQRAWRSWKCRQVPAGFWLKIDKESLRQYISEIGEELGLLDRQAWYRVSWAQLQHVGAAHVFVSLGGISAALKLAFPEEKWDDDRLSQAKSSEAALKLKAADRRRLRDSLIRILGPEVREDHVILHEGVPHSYHFMLESHRVLLNVAVKDSSGLASAAAQVNGFRYIELEPRKKYTDEEISDMVK